MTRTRRTTTTETLPIFERIVDVEKRWVHFRELYPCIVDDPVQVYIHHRVQPPCPIANDDSNSSANKMKMRFFQRFASKLFFVSTTGDESRARVVDTLLTTADRAVSNDSFFSIPIRNDRLKLRVMVDVLATSDFLRTLDPSIVLEEPKDGRRYHVVCIVSSDRRTAYQRYKAHFIRYVLGCASSRYHAHVDLSRIFFFDMNTGRVSTYDVSTHRETMTNRIRKDVAWIRSCACPEVQYTLDPPSHAYLYPNMKVVARQEWVQAWKTRYAERIHEITLMYRCQPVHRQMLHRMGIRSFADPRFEKEAPMALFESSPLNRCILERSMALYHADERCDDCIYIPDEGVEIPETSVNLFVDFETCDGFIYWIGVGEHSDEKGWKYRWFTASKLTNDGQLEVMQRFQRYLDKFERKTVYYWYAEVRFWNHANDINAKPVSLEVDDWVDLYEVFSKTPIVVKDCFDFKLKTLAKAMRRFGMINVNIPTACSNGVESMVIAKRYFERRQEEEDEQQDADWLALWSYNCFDCRVLYEMWRYLKNRMENKET